MGEDIDETKLSMSWLLSKLDDGYGDLLYYSIFFYRDRHFFKWALHPPYYPESKSRVLYCLIQPDTPRFDIFQNNNSKQTTVKLRNWLTVRDKI